jgi:hypothetical protein
LPANIGSLQVKKVSGAGSRRNGADVEIDPLARKWDAFLE